MIIQITDGAQNILRQRYYYGGSGSVVRGCNARGISVWPGPTPETTLVAICGETYDKILPQAQADNTNATGTTSDGFLAVFDGNLTLRWSHHAFGQTLDRSCAITDVSVRIEGEGAQQRDVVTYCGVSSHGLVPVGFPLAPVKPFAALGGSSSGSTAQSSTGPFGQWDGIVGRVSNGISGYSIDFHSIVSGPDQDGLFGIAEMDADRFVVVGATELLTTGTAPAGFAFPGRVGLQGSYYLGVVMAFNALPTRTTGALILENVQAIGTAVAGEETHTFTLARDVVVLRDWSPNLVPAPGGGVQAIHPPLHYLAVCGSTSDPNGIGSPPNSLQGPTDGFVLTFFDDTRIVGAPGLVGGAGRFYGGPGDDGLTGIQCWNEYADHAVGCGFTQGAGSSTTDIGVESYFVNAVGPELVERIRSGTIGGTANERPAAMGALNATGPTAPLPFATGPLGDSAGGGISVDERARVNVVGQTVGTDFPETLGARPHDSGFDAVRVVFDMLPLGVGRSDGTGDAGSFVLPATFSGGTTPLCALAPFGKLIGQPAPAVPRMLIDYRGPQPAAGVTGASIFVSRPTAPIVAGQWASSVVLAGFQFGFPGVAVPPLMLLEGVEMYTTDNPYIYVAGFGYSNQAHIELLAPLPTPPSLGLPMTVQMFFWVPSTVPGGVGPAPCPGVSEFTATPALWMPL